MLTSTCCTVLKSLLQFEQFEICVLIILKSTGYLADVGLQRGKRVRGSDIVSRGNDVMDIVVGEDGQEDFSQSWRKTNRKTSVSRRGGQTGRHQ